MTQHLSMFTNADQDSARKELDCYGYLLKRAIELFAQGEFNKALIYHQNIIRVARCMVHMTGFNDNALSAYQLHWTLPFRLVHCDHKFISD